MQIVRRSVSDLTLDPHNARLHSQANLDAIRSSLDRFGQAAPIVVDARGTVIGGNGTLQAAIALGWKEIEIVEFTGTPTDARALAVALNRTGELASWDLDMLGRTLADLSDLGHAPEALGFDAESLERLFPLEQNPPSEPFRTDAPDIEKTSEDPKPLIQYALIFDSADQEQRFHGWLAGLQDQYPDHATQAARLDQHIQAQSAGGDTWMRDQDF